MTTWVDNAKNIMTGCDCDVVVIAGNGGVPVAFCETDGDAESKPFGSPSTEELQQMSKLLTSHAGTAITIFGKRFIILSNDDAGLIGKSGKASICVRQCKTIFIASVLRDDAGKFGKMRDAMEKFTNYYVSIEM